MSWIVDLSGFLSSLCALEKLKHGDRSVRIVNNKNAETTINGKRKRIERWEVPFNGTTLPDVIRIAEKYGYMIDPAVRRGPDPLVDRLRRSSRACWLRTDSRGPAVVVFDLERPDKRFSEAVKAGFKGRFSCSPNDDWNWVIECGDETKDRISRLAHAFGFATDPAIKDWFGSSIFPT